MTKQMTIVVIGSLKVLVYIVNREQSESGKCPKISNTLFQIWFAYILLFLCTYFIEYLLEWKTL